MTRPAVLVVTNAHDRTAEYVVDELDRRGARVFRCDPADFPTRMTLSARLDTGWTGTLCLDGRTVALDDVHGVYYRKPRKFGFPDGMSDADHDWATRQGREGLGGVLSCLPRWLNHSAAIDRASRKPYQLVTAARLGLRVPRTIVTNSPAAARRFAAEVGAVVHKPLTGPHMIGATGPMLVNYTTQVAAADLDESIALTTHLFQERIAKQYEIRLTVVDHAMFAARIDALSARAQVDWRSDYANLRHSITAVPDGVATQIRQLMRRLGLRFGAIDLIVTPDGEYVFLEINPNGQWAWIQEETGMPIAGAIADALLADIGCDDLTCGCSGLPRR